MTLHIILLWLLLGLLWALVSEIIILLVAKLGKVRLEGARTSKILYHWTLFSLGGLDVAILVYILRIANA